MFVTPPLTSMPIICSVLLECSILRLNTQGCQSLLEIWLLHPNEFLEVAWLFPTTSYDLTATALTCVHDYGGPVHLLIRRGACLQVQIIKKLRQHLHYQHDKYVKVINLISMMCMFKLSTLTWNSKALSRPQAPQGGTFASITCPSRLGQRIARLSQRQYLIGMNVSA